VALEADVDVRYEDEPRWPRKNSKIRNAAGVDLFLVYM